MEGNGDNDDYRLEMEVSYTYLLYRTISGSQISSDGTYSSVTPPYSEGSHLNL